MAFETVIRPRPRVTEMRVELPNGGCTVENLIEALEKLQSPQAFVEFGDGCTVSYVVLTDDGTQVELT